MRTALALMVGWLGCKGAAAPASTGAPPPASNSAASSTPTAAPPPPSEPTAPGEIGNRRDHDAADLAHVSITRITAGDSGDTWDQLHEQKDLDAVARCYAKLPAGHRTDVPFGVKLERVNPEHEGGGFGFGGGGGGQDPYPPRIEEPGFTACVTREVSQSPSMSLSASTSSVKSVRIELLAYPYGSVDRYLTGSIGHGRP